MEGLLIVETSTAVMKREQRSAYSVGPRMGKFKS